MAPRSTQHFRSTVLCPYCQASIRAGEHSVVCSACKMPHHQECWEENGQCTTYGCKGVQLPSAGIHAQRPASESVIEIRFEEVEAQPHACSRKRIWWLVVGLAAVMALGGWWAFYGPWP